MALKTIGVAVVYAVLLLAFSLTYGHPSTVSGADAPESTPPETCTVCHKGAR